MNFLKRYLISILLVITDSFVCFFSILITYWLRISQLAKYIITIPGFHPNAFHVPFITQHTILKTTQSTIPEFHPLSVYIHAFPYVLLIWVTVFYFKGLYSLKRSTSRLNESLQIFYSLSLVILIVMAGSFLKHFDYSRSIVLLFYVLIIPLTIIFRFIIRKIQQKMLRKGFNKVLALIVGTGETGKMVLNKMVRFPSLGYEPVGFIETMKTRIEKSEVNGIPILGSIQELKEIIAKTNAKEVFFANPNIPRKKILSYIVQCEHLNVKFRLVSDLFEIITSRIDIDDVADIPIVDLGHGRFSKLNLIIKTLLDFILSAFFFLLISPFFIIIAIVIRLDTPGPILFKQERVGLRGKRFNIYKFRTMFKDVKRFELAPIKPGDKRITRVGKILRRFSLDELPQLLNVVKGEMSLVGPRPEMPFIVENYSDWERKRLDIKPGLTGLWQILGRKDLPLHENLEYDFYYIKNQSLILDIAIIIKTIPVIIFGKGAY
jgi:exopolysaccharide biosynthesis polyprenyl glycosylphosphotransferase